MSAPQKPVLPRWYEVDTWFAMTILLGFLLLSALQVLSRFILHLPFTWTEELTAALVIWMTFSGAIAVERSDSQIRVELMENILPPRGVAFLFVLFDLAILVTLAALVVGGWDTLSETSYQKTPALGIPLNLVTSAVPLACFPLAAFVIRNMIRRLRIILVPK